MQVVATLVSDTVHQALISHVGTIRPIHILTTPRFKCYVPAYIYVIKGYSTPQVLENLVWCVPVASAIPLFTHSG